MMRVRTLRFAAPAAILAVGSISVGTAAAAQEWPLPEGAIPLAETVAEAAAATGREDDAAIGEAAGTAHADIGEPPASRLLQSLGEHNSRPASSPAPAEGRDPDPVAGAAGAQAAGILYGCPRALLGSLLAGAAETLGPETGDAVSALAIERETLALCRERQEIVNGIVALEVELGGLLAEALPADAGVPAPAAGAAAAETPIVPIVKESAPVRVVSLPPADDDAGEAAEEKPERAPAPPDYAWFSIIGIAGDLRAGVSDGSRVWFVRHGDRLPGGVHIEEILSRPPGVATRMGAVTGRGVRTDGAGTDGAGTDGAGTDGAGKALLPYRPLAAGAGAAAGGQRAGEGP